MATVRFAFLLLLLTLIASTSAYTLNTGLAQNASFFKEEVQPVILQEVKPTSPFDAHVLIYHSVRPWYEGMTPDVRLYTVRPESFEAHLQYMHEEGYNFVSFDDLILASEGKKTLPLKPVVLTFDDGWMNQYLYAFPLLKKYDATATFFIFSNAIGYENYMTWDQIRELEASGMTIGSHSKSHPYLDRITDTELTDNEVALSKEIIENEIATDVDLFAYPFGGVTEQLIAHLKASGYKAARIIGGRVYRSDDNPFLVSGITVVDELANLKKLLTY